MTNGAGYIANVECQACVGGPNGEEIAQEQFIINDYKAEFTRANAHANIVVLLFNGDLSPLIGQSVYILKKEKRYGFMLDLCNKVNSLAVNSFYWPADEVSISLSVPKEFSGMRCDWLREGGPGPQQEQISPVQNLVPAGFVCYTRGAENFGGGCQPPL